MLVLERFIGVWPPERCGQPLTDRVRRHAIRGSHLELLDADGVVLTRLEAVALR